MPVKRTKENDASAKLLKNVIGGIERKKHVGKTKKELKSIKKELLVKNALAETAEKKSKQMRLPKKQKGLHFEEMKQALNGLIKGDNSNKNLPNIANLSGRGQIMAESVETMKSTQQCVQFDSDPLGSLLQHANEKYGDKQQNAPVKK